MSGRFKKEVKIPLFMLCLVLCLIVMYITEGFTIKITISTTKFSFWDPEIPQQTNNMWSVVNFNDGHIIDCMLPKRVTLFDSVIKSSTHKSDATWPLKYYCSHKQHGIILGQNVTIRLKK